MKFLFLLGSVAAVLLFGLAVQLPAPALAQEAPSAPDAPYQDDVASVDAIIHALYDVISGPVGEARDWDRFRALFIPSCREEGIRDRRALDVCAHPPGSHARRPPAPRPCSATGYFSAARGV